MRRVATIAGTLLLAACGGAPRGDAIPASPPAEPATEARDAAELFFDHRLASHYSVTGIDVVVDGRLVYWKRDAGWRAGRHAMGHAEVLPGPHTVLVRLFVIYPSGSPGEACRIEIEDAITFEHPGGRHALRVVLGEAGRLASFDERPVLSFEGPLSKARPEGAELAGSPARTTHGAWCSGDGTLFDAIDPQG